MLRWLVCCLIAVGCGSASLGAPDRFTDTDPAPPPATDDSGGEVEAASVTHSFGAAQLSAFEEITVCASWTVDNEQALYAQAVTLANEGSFHHGNWFIVPDSVYDGPDGYWRCGDRGFDELEAAQAGTVLYAQSTQAYVETQGFIPGAVVKLPPNSRIVGSLHLLNLAPRALNTGLWLTLDLIHPRDVTAVLSPFRLTYRDLKIPAQAQSHHTASCDFATALETAQKTLDLRLHYVLPHYHGLGNLFDLEVVGGAMDGQSVYRLDGFNADQNGRTFDPPLDLRDATGLRFTCGYNNWMNSDRAWGYGIDEMCVMLGMGEADVLVDAVVLTGSSLVDVVDGVRKYEGPCLVGLFDKSEGQGPPSPEELAAPLYVPPVDPGDENIPPVPECRDADPAAPALVPEPTLSTIASQIFTPACTFSSCHGDGAAAGLALGTADRETLLGHQVRADTAMPLVAPGDPDGSWLYQVLARCTPTTETGVETTHMPRNAPVLLDDGLVATLRAWIAAGAPE